MMQGIRLSACIRVHSTVIARSTLASFNGWIGQECFSTIELRILEYGGQDCLYSSLCTRYLQCIARSMVLAAGTSLSEISVFWVRLVLERSREICKDTSPACHAPASVILAVLSRLHKPLQDHGDSIGRECVELRALKCSVCLQREFLIRRQEKDILN